MEEITNLCNPKIIQGHSEKGEIHFDSVYTDMSCYDLQKSSVRKNVKEFLAEMKNSSRYQHIQDKLIFGVDWYLSLLTGAPEYREYAESFFETMNQSDTWQWYKSSLVNPAVFYGLDNIDVVENMYSAIKNEKSDKDKVNSGYKRIIKIKDQVELIRNKIGSAQQKVYV